MVSGCAQKTYFASCDLDKGSNFGMFPCLRYISAKMVRICPLIRKIFKGDITAAAVGKLDT